MKPRIEPLPDWVLTGTQGAFYDTEEVTILSLLSKIYKKINEVIAVTDEAYDYMKTNLTETATTLFEEALENGDITASLGVSYDSVNESLTLSIEAN